MSKNTMMSREEPKSVDMDLIIRETINGLVKKTVEEPTFIRKIIAMKGDSYTGKSTCADAVAKSFKCGVLCFDDILDSLSPSTPTSPEEAQRLEEEAFAIILQMTVLQVTLMRPVVIDSPLSNPVHLQRLLHLMVTLKCGLSIIECRPAVKYAWKMRFDKRDHRQEYWFKPKEWTHVKETPSVEWNQDLPDMVSRVIVDTTDYVDLPNLGPATLDTAACGKGHLLHFEQWRPDNPIHPSLTFLNTKLQPHDECGIDGRHMLEQHPSSSSLVDVCGSCQGPISYTEPAYSCKRCNNLALHKSCAELPDYHKTDIHPSMSNIREEEEDNIISTHGLWEAHLRSRLLPTVLLHEGAPSKSVCFWKTSPMNPREYQCAACKLPGNSIFGGYTCLKTTFRFNLHVDCALLPIHVAHIHGRHQHDMRLVFGTRVIQEDYLCDVCGDFRDPSAWFYCCATDDDCGFVSHLHCIYAPEDA